MERPRQRITWLYYEILDVSTTETRGERTRRAVLITEYVAAERVFEVLSGVATVKGGEGERYFRRKEMGS